MDKSWMHADRRSQEFDLGVDEFLMFALESGCDVNKVSCPCLKCAHGQSWKAMTVKDHLIEFGKDETYKEWIWHGEGDSSRISIPNRESETVEQDSSREGEMPYDIGESDDEELADDPKEFLRVVEDGDQPLYPCCTRFTKLSALTWMTMLMPLAALLVKPEEELVYFFDPVRRRLPAFGEEWTSVVNSAIKIYKSTQDKTQRKTISWLPMLGVPEQFGSTDCGFFIMRYMKDIVEDKNLDFASNWRYMATPPHAYTPKHIDEVRVEWVRFLMKYHIK
ncbi:hypothetical protein OROGR_004757 [Orobanche gracilis]